MTNRLITSDRFNTICVDCNYTIFYRNIFLYLKGGNIYLTCLQFQAVVKATGRVTANDRRLDDTTLSFLEPAFNDVAF